MSVSLEVDRAALAALEKEIVTLTLGVGTQSVHAATRRLEREFEGLTRSAVKGRAWRAWKSAVYPRGGGPAYDPVGEVFGNGGSRTRGMLNYWTMPGINRAKHGQYLAVPLRAALGTSKGRRISPREWEGRFGAKLRPLFRAGKNPLLVADGALSAGGFVPAAKAGAKRRGGQQLGRTGTVAVFVLIDTQPHANTISLPPAIRRAEDFMVAEFARRLKRAIR